MQDDKIRLEAIDHLKNKQDSIAYQEVMRESGSFAAYDMVILLETLLPKLLSLRTLLYNILTAIDHLHAKKSIERSDMKAFDHCCRDHAQRLSFIQKEIAGVCHHYAQYLRGSLLGHFSSLMAYQLQHRGQAQAIEADHCCWPLSQGAWYRLLDILPYKSFKQERRSSVQGWCRVKGQWIWCPKLFEGYRKKVKKPWLTWFWRSAYAS